MPDSAEYGLTASSTGYLNLLPFGFIFGSFTVELVCLELYVLGALMKSEYFNTGGRTIKN